MSRLERELDPERFVRIHRSAIVQIDRIKELLPEFHGDFDGGASQRDAGPLEPPLPRQGGTDPSPGALTSLGADDRCFRGAIDPSTGADPQPARDGVVEGIQDCEGRDRMRERERQQIRVPIRRSSTRRGRRRRSRR